MIITTENNYKALEEWLNGKKKVFLVCDGSIKFLKDFNRKLEEISISIISFSDFHPNPLYDSVVKGVKVFRDQECDSIMAVGGGSAMDVAKCIKLYSNMDGNGADGDFLNQEIVPNRIPFLAMPTTAGTGSEATRYAVIYYKGEKQSITHESCIPSTVLLNPKALKTLPIYQKKSTMMDALCHAIESFWSVNSTEESKEYSKNAIKLIIDNIDSYLENTDNGNRNMLLAAHMAGKAINITQTTAGHAMCYKLTSKYGITHGHAAALCVRKLWPMMISMTYSHCSDPRGKKYLHAVFDEIADTIGCRSSLQAAWKFEQLFFRLDLEVPDASFEEIKELAENINPVRLKNNPIQFRTNDFLILYERILDSKEALIDRLVINIADRLEDYFKYRAFHYNKSADPERIILDFMDNRKHWLPVMPHNVNISKELESKISIEEQVCISVNKRTSTIDKNDNTIEFQMWKKQLRRALKQQDRLLGITNFYIRNAGDVVLQFEIERESHKESFVTEF